MDGERYEYCSLLWGQLISSNGVVPFLWHTHSIHHVSGSMEVKGIMGLTCDRASTHSHTLTATLQTTTHACTSHTIPGAALPAVPTPIICALLPLFFSPSLSPDCDSYHPDRCTVWISSLWRTGALAEPLHCYQTATEAGVWVEGAGGTLK